MISILTHSDECSGTTVMADGTRIYWSEGRSSPVRVVYKNGKKEWVEPYLVNGHKNPVYVALSYIDGYAKNVVYRIMTKKEEEEWEATHGL